MFWFFTIGFSVKKYLRRVIFDVFRKKFCEKNFWPPKSARWTRDRTKKSREDVHEACRSARANAFTARASNPYSIAVSAISFFVRAIAFAKLFLRFARGDRARRDARRRAEFARARTPFVKWSRGFLHCAVVIAVQCCRFAMARTC